MLLVAEDGVAAAGGKGSVLAWRLEKPPVQVARIAHDVVRPAPRRVAGMPETLDAPDRLSPPPSSRGRRNSPARLRRPGPCGTASVRRPPRLARRPVPPTSASRPGFLETTSRTPHLTARDRPTRRAGAPGRPPGRPARM